MGGMFLVGVVEPPLVMIKRMTTRPHGYGGEVFRRQLLELLQGRPVHDCPPNYIYPD